MYLSSCWCSRREKIFQFLSFTYALRMLSIHRQLRLVRPQRKVALSRKNYSTSPYQEIFQLGKDNSTNYRRITTDFVHTSQLGGHDLLHISNQALSLLSSTAMKDVSHLFRSSHLQQLATILTVPYITFVYIRVKHVCDILIGRRSVNK